MTSNVTLIQVPILQSLNIHEYFPLNEQLQGFTQVNKDAQCCKWMTTHTHQHTHT